jgi:hypothetical protein
VLTGKIAASLEFLVKVPLLPAISLAKINGNLADGIVVTLGSSTVIKGTLKLYLTNYGTPPRKWVTIDMSVQVFGKKFDASGFRLFPLPSVYFVEFSSVEVHTDFFLCPGDVRDISRSLERASRSDDPVGFASSCLWCRSV